MQYGIKRAGVKISASLLGKIDKYEDLISEEMLPPQQNRIVENLLIYHLGKHLKTKLKQLKNNEKNK